MNTPISDASNRYGQTFLGIGFGGLVLMKEVPGSIRIGIRIEDLIKPRVALVAIQEFHKLLDRDALLFAAAPERNGSGK
jgi:hypothetical protein